MKVAQFSNRRNVADAQLAAVRAYCFHPPIRSVFIVVIGGDASYSVFHFVVLSIIRNAQTYRSFRKRLIEKKGKQ